MDNVKIGNLRIHSFIVPRGYESNGFLFWHKSWNEDLDIVWWHLHRWCFCIQYKDYFLTH